MSLLSSNDKKHTESVPAIHTLLGKGTLWKGEIHIGANSLRIEGSVEGTIHSEGQVTIAPCGSVLGTIHAKHLIVTGQAKGTLKIIDCLEIHGTGWVEGDVEMSSLVVDEGGTLQGTCTRRGGSTKEADATEASKAKAKTNANANTNMNTIEPPKDQSVLSMGSAMTTPQLLGATDLAAIGSSAQHRQKAR